MTANVSRHLACAVEVASCTLTHTQAGADDTAAVITSDNSDKPYRRLICLWRQHITSRRGSADVSLSSQFMWCIIGTEPVTVAAQTKANTAFRYSITGVVVWSNTHVCRCVFYRLSHPCYMVHPSYLYNTCSSSAAAASGYKPSRFVPCSGLLAYLSIPWSIHVSSAGRKVLVH